MRIVARRIVSSTALPEATMWAQWQRVRTSGFIHCGKFVFDVRGVVNGVGDVDDELGVKGLGCPSRPPIQTEVAW